MILIIPRTRDLGDGFQVRRALPDAKCRSVGPFVFFDQMGPVTLKSNQGLDVRPHPHIGLATVTYLFEGEIMHRDSLGTVQAIRPGEVNWMTAGRGIVHSERTPPALKASGSKAFGIQTWVALPEAHEETEPGFYHFSEIDLPRQDNLRLIVGTLGGLKSPVPTFSKMFYADLQLSSDFVLNAEHEERAAYVTEGSLVFDKKQYPAGQMLVFPRGEEIHLKGEGRILLLGGEPLGQRYLWWNFVSSRKERIEQAAADWKAGRFLSVPGESDFIPLPERGPGGVASYP